jgi:glycerol kinase
MSQKARLVLGLDIGTSSIKLGVFDSDLHPLASLSAPVQTDHQNDHVELDAENVFSDTRKLLDQMSEELGADTEKVVGIGIAAQRSTVVFWNKSRVLAPAMTWQDVRTASDIERLAQHEPMIAAKTGLRLSPHYSASKIAWALANIPSVQSSSAARELLAAPLSSYLIWKLTGGQTYATDHSQAQRTLLFDLKKRRWDPGLCRLFNIPRHILPELRDVRANYGCLALGGKKIPILVSIGDTQAASFCAGLGRTTKLAIQYGTGAFVASYCGNKPFACPGLLTSLYVSEKKRATYFVEGTVNSAGSLLDWLKGNPEIRRIDSSFERSLLIPALTGLGSPHWLPNATPALVGSTAVENIQELGAEAIAYRVREILNLLERFVRRTPKTLLVSGGLANDREFLQIQANVLQRPLVCSRREASAAAGAAALVLDRKPPKPRTETVVRPNRQKVFASASSWARIVSLVKREVRRPALVNTLWEKKLSELRPLFFAHRGASHVALENTLSAFDLAVRNGADGIELDVRLTQDNVPVILHDSTLSRTSEGKGRIEKTLLCNRPRTVPTLSDVLTSVPTDVLLYIEIKDDVSGSRVWKEALDVVQRHHSRDRVSFCSFNTKLALRFKKECPDFVVGAILGRHHPKLDPRRPVYPELDLLSFGTTVTNPALIERCRLQTQMTFVWTVDRAAAMKRFIDLGLDAIVTNRIELFNIKACDPKRS